MSLKRRVSSPYCLLCTLDFSIEPYLPARSSDLHSHILPQESCSNNRQPFRDSRPQSNINKKCEIREFLLEILEFLAGIPEFSAKLLEFPPELPQFPSVFQEFLIEILEVRRRFLEVTADFLQLPGRIPESRAGIPKFPAELYEY